MYHAALTTWNRLRACPSNTLLLSIPCAWLNQKPELAGAGYSTTIMPFMS